MIEKANRQDFGAYRADTGEQRDPERIPLQLSTQAVLDSGEKLDVVLRNISSAGFMGETEAHLPVASVLSVELPDTGVARACVRWSLGGRFGAQFEGTIGLHGEEADADPSETRQDFLARRAGEEFVAAGRAATGDARSLHRALAHCYSSSLRRRPRGA